MSRERWSIERGGEREGIEAVRSEPLCDAEKPLPSLGFITLDCTTITKLEVPKALHT